MNIDKITKFYDKSMKSVKLFCLVAGVLLISCKSNNNTEQQLEAESVNDFRITEDFAKKVQKYDEVENFHNGLGRVKYCGLYGYIDKSGDEVVTCEYDYLGPFSEGLALVTKNDEHAYINDKNEVVIPYTGEYRWMNDFSDGLAKVEGYNYKQGYIDKTGKLVIPLEYSGTGDFHNGLVLISKDGRYGYIDKTGNIAIPCIYKSAADFKDGMANVMLENDAISINVKGEAVEKPKKEAPSNPNVSGYRSVEEFSDGLAAVWDGNKWGFVDSTGTVVIPLIYACVSPGGKFNNGLCGVTLDWGGKWAMINTKGEEVTPYIYSSPGSEFSEGLAVVKIGDRYGYMDKYDNDTFRILQKEK